MYIGCRRLLVEVDRTLDYILAANRTRILLTNDELDEWRNATIAQLHAWLLTLGAKVH